jgi:hypothetical protein
MPKCFNNLPAEFEQYNPELLRFSDFLDETSAGYPAKVIETWDNEGLLHSFDDKPSLGYDYQPESLKLIWTEHGKVYRQGKPAVVFMAPEKQYWVYNNDENLHSFDDTPASIYASPTKDKVEISWMRNGVLHRENNLPALIVHREYDETEITSSQTTSIEENYYVDGERHRGGSLPAYCRDKEKVWFVHGNLHNATGKAITFHNPVFEPNLSWGLYGVGMNGEIFTQIITYQTQNQVPLWVAFLRVLDVIDDQKIKPFKDNTNSWNINVPISWVLRAWSVTEEVIKNRINELQRGKIEAPVSVNHWRSDSQLKNFLKNIIFEENDLMTQKSKKGLTNA